MEYKNLSLQEAAHIVVQDKLKPIGGEGGLIAVDAQGNFTLPYNSDGMYRGWQRVGEQPNVAVFEENL
jgi:beta-aspartyl-peptidase (threonine type)